MAANYCSLSMESLLHITGPDTLTFLQGQTTCDTGEVSAERAVPGAYCTPQGRMICDFMLVQLGQDHFALRMRHDTVAAAAAAFGKYIMFSKAELDAARDDWTVIACWGDDSKSALQGLGFSVTSRQYGAASCPGYVVVQVDETGSAFEIYVEAAHRDALLETLSTQLEEAGEAAWQALQISAGIGRVEGSNSGEFLPQMLNYDATGHVNFTKGCYTGQEIVARLHYRGKSKRRMYRVQLDATSAPRAGTEVYPCGSGQACGTVVNFVNTQSGCSGLVTATEAGLAAGLCVNTEDDQPMQVIALPYAVKD